MELPIITFTDGSYSKKNNVSGYSYCVYNAYLNSYSITYGKINEEFLSNQVAELYAIKELFDKFLTFEHQKLFSTFNNNKLIVYTDSNYCIGIITEWFNNWNNLSILNTKSLLSIEFSNKIINNIDKNEENKELLQKQYKNMKLINNLMKSYYRLRTKFLIDIKHVDAHKKIHEHENEILYYGNYYTDKYAVIGSFEVSSSNTILLE